jgi:hypothetical protein
LRSRLSGWSATDGPGGVAVLVVVCLGLAAISLVVARDYVAYDPQSWLLWGREILHLDLNTRDAATSVKPLAIYLDIPIALSGSHAPSLWLLIARAAALASIALAYRVGHRLGGVGAGLVAALALVVSDSFLGYLFMRGMSEPMSVAMGLAAVDAYVAGRVRWSWLFLALAALLRPEAWLFLIAYSLWLAYQRRSRLRIAAVIVSVVIPPSWFVIDWFGARQFFRSAGAAKTQSQGGPLLTREPGLATFKETWHLASGAVIVLFALALLVALVRWRRTGRPGPQLWLGLGAILWLVVDAVLAQGRFATGAPRYLLPGDALACVVVGMFVADTARWLIRRLPGPRAAIAGTAIAGVAVVAVFAMAVDHTVRQTHYGVVEGRQYARLTTNLNRVVATLGGRAAVVRCGPIGTYAFQTPTVAWVLQVPVGTITDRPPPGSGTLIEQGGQPPLPASDRRTLHKVASIGTIPQETWTVFSTCPL